jgi:signal transduction histidine kinase
MLIAVSAAITAGRVLEPLAGQFLLSRLIKGSNPFSTTLRAFQFVLIVFIVSLISASVSVLSLNLAAVLNTDLLITRFFEFWLSNISGMVLFAPLLISMAEPENRKVSLAKFGEFALLALCATLAYLVLSADPISTVAPFTYPFVVIPFLLWLAFRFQTSISTTVLVLVAVMAFYFTGKAMGPFIMEGGAANSIFLVQLYVGVISLSVLVLSSAVNERQQAQRDLRKFNENLESMVADRTKALQQEISARHEAQVKLQQTNNELTKRNTELDNFVYSVSHDLRAPISSILGLINLAKKDKVNNAGLYLDMIEKSARQQDYFIREILDQSRNARSEVKREPVRLSELIEETFEQLNHTSPNGATVAKIIEIEQPETFHCDSWRLKIIFNNLLSNAIRYRNGRDPVIRVQGLIKDNKAILCVEDNGRGISKEHLPNLGKMFYRATDDGAGSGLGLYIVKETIAKLRGSIAIESVEGEGTTVKLEIPEVDDTDKSE